MSSTKRPKTWPNRFLLPWSHVDFCCSSKVFVSEIPPCSYKRTFSKMYPSAFASIFDRAIVLVQSDFCISLLTVFFIMGKFNPEIMKQKDKIIYSSYIGGYPKMEHYPKGPLAKFPGMYCLLSFWGHSNFWSFRVAGPESVHKNCLQVLTNQTYPNLAPAQMLHVW